MARPLVHLVGDLEIRRVRDLECQFFNNFPTQALSFQPEKQNPVGEKVAENPFHMNVDGVQQVGPHRFDEPVTARQNPVFREPPRAEPGTGSRDTLQAAQSDGLGGKRLFRTISATFDCPQRPLPVPGSRPAPGRPFDRNKAPLHRSGFRSSVAVEPLGHTSCWSPSAPKCHAGSVGKRNLRPLRQKTSQAFIHRH